MDLREVQTIQAEYDREFWSHPESEATISHSERHIAKLTGKLATLVETLDHGETPDLSVLDNEVIPDLLIYAARLANNRKIHLEVVFQQRTEELRKRFSNT